MELALTFYAVLTQYNAHNVRNSRKENGTHSYNNRISKGTRKNMFKQRMNWPTGSLEFVT